MHAVATRCVRHARPICVSVRDAIDRSTRSQAPPPRSAYRVLTTVHLHIDGASAIRVVNSAFVGPDVRLCWSSYTSLARRDASL